VLQTPAITPQLDVAAITTADSGGVLKFGAGEMVCLQRPNFCATITLEPGIFSDIQRA
jgi:hypothetical protein